MNRDAILRERLDADRAHAAHDPSNHMHRRGIPVWVRFVLAIVGLVAIVAALAGVKVAQISTLIGMGKQAAKAGPPPEAVSSSMSQKQTWEGTLSAVGSITAAKGVAVSNDAPGIVSRILFDSGATVRDGQILVELDTSVERAQLASSRARLQLAKLTFGRSQALLGSGSISKAQVDSDDAQLRAASTDVGALEAQLARKTVRAPFSGRLGIRLVNLGQYLTSGTPVTELESTDSVFVDFTLPQQRLADVKVGVPVHVTIEGAAGSTHEGAVSAVDPAVDSTTRTIKVRATVPNKQDNLRPGMFATVSVVLPQAGSFVTVPATAVIHASYGDSVYILEDKMDETGRPVVGPDGKPVKVARQQFVRVGESRGDFVAILDGLAEGQALVTAGAFKLRNGASVVVNNEIKANPQLAPRPENK
jgi:membrane fusion protein (multidrug efflux system)